MHFGALPDGRANAPEMSNTFLTPTNILKSLSEAACCVKVTADPDIAIKKTGARHKSVRHCRERMADVGG